LIHRKKFRRTIPEEDNAFLTNGFEGDNQIRARSLPG
jgi:hypothetical protein